MKILLIGGTGFIGPFVVQHLQQSGHEITVFHRGNRSVPAGVQQIIGDRNRLPEYREQFAREEFDTVIDFVLSSGPQATQLLDTFRGIAERGLQELPVNEDSAVRTKHIPYPPEVLKRVVGKKVMRSSMARLTRGDRRN